MQILPSSGFKTDLLEFLYQYQDIPVALFVSGGSQINVVAEVFKTLVESGVVLSKLEVFLVDERWGVDKANTNYYQLTQAIGQEVISKTQAKFHPLPSASAVTKVASEYSQILDNTLNSRVVTLALLGVGADWHTAGILPHAKAKTELFMQHLAVGLTYDSEFTSNKFLERVTLGFKAIAAMQQVWVYATGEEKWPVVKELASPVGQVQADFCAKPAAFLATLQNIKVYSDLPPA